MANKSILKRISRALTPDPTEADFEVFDSEVSSLKKKLKEKITLKTLDEVNSKLEKYTKRIDLSPLENALTKLRASVEGQESLYLKELEEEAKEIRAEMKSSASMSASDISKLEARLALVEKELSTPKEDKITPLIAEIQGLETRVNHAMAFERQESASSVSKVKGDSETSLKKEVDKLLDLIEKLRAEFFTKLGSLGGGSMNRQVLFNSVDRLTKYTDYNLIPGNNVNFTVTEDNVNKRVNLTISSSGSGGGGITRFIQNVAVNTAAGSDPDTDYVYLVSGTTTITLPTAIGNENLYTVKNVGDGVVTVDTTGAETIDDGPDAVLEVKYTSVDLISNGSNWKVT